MQRSLGVLRNIIEQHGDVMAFKMDGMHLLQYDGSRQEIMLQNCAGVANRGWLY